MTTMKSYFVLLFFAITRDENSVMKGPYNPDNGKVIKINSLKTIIHTLITF